MRSPTISPEDSTRRIRIALAAMLLGLSLPAASPVRATCERRSPAQLDGLNNAELRSAYCGARTLLSKEVAATRQALADNQPEAKANIAACYDTVTGIIAKLSARKIDVDAARERCDAGASAADIPRASPQASASKPASAKKAPAKEARKKKAPSRKTVPRKAAK